MGFRFTLESANTVANLTFGKVMSCYRDIYSSLESYQGFIHFLKQFEYNMYTNEPENYIRTIMRIRRSLPRYDESSRANTQLKLDIHALDALKALSEIFERCTIKSLLLPTMKESEMYKYDFMTSHKTLTNLFKLHEGESCLILQPQEQPQNATILNAFPNFEIALRQADMWPAVLFWEDSDNCVFVPVRHEKELLELFTIVKYERHPFDELKRIAEYKKRNSHYIIQLSDLHFGAKNVDIAERRLKSLLKTQLSKTEIEDSISFVVTGDAVDSPKRTTENIYTSFAEYIEERYGKKPIRVLGNHDVNNMGLAFFHGNQNIANIVGDYPKIRIIEESKIILLLFNSNTNGSLAEGEIGPAQMSEMGNLLDEVDNLEEYILIAVLHHHVLPIPKPNYYNKKWFERIMPNGFMDISLRLIDADLFMEWLHQRNVRVVLHGHKHIPFLAKSDGITVIGCGSSTGQIVHKEKGKTFISYNVIKVDKQAVTCTQFVEEIYGAGAKDIKTEVIEL